MALKPAKKFIGHREIATFNVSEHKTPKGVDIYEVQYKNGVTELVPAVMFEKIVTDEPLDPTALFELRVTEIVRAILNEIMGEYDPKLSEWDRIAMTVKLSIENNYENAEALLWKTDTKSYLDIFRVLQSAPKPPVDK